MVVEDSSPDGTLAVAEMLQVTYLTAAVVHVICPRLPVLPVLALPCLVRARTRSP